MLRLPGMRTFVTAGLGREPSFAGAKPGVPQFAQLDAFRDNWWCAIPSEARMQAAGYTPAVLTDYWTSSQMNRREMPSPLRLVYAGDAIGSPAFLSADQKREAQQQWSRLEQAPTAPNYLGNEAIAYARKHPGDPRTAEALHLVVRATRYGCTDEATGRYSRQAFQLLHSRYPNSTWAKKTPYWFGQ